MEWADSNIFISEDITSLSNCCRLVSDVKNLAILMVHKLALKVNTINLAPSTPILDLKSS